MFDLHVVCIVVVAAGVGRSVVEHTPASVCLMPPFDVAGDGRRNLWIALLSRYGKLGKKLRFMAQSNICMGRQNSTWCMYFTLFFR